jgi:hypothetical protein
MTSRSCPTLGLVAAAALLAGPARADFEVFTRASLRAASSTDAEVDVPAPIDQEGLTSFDRTLTAQTHGGTGTASLRVEVAQQAESVGVTASGGSYASHALNDGVRSVGAGGSNDFVARICVDQRSSYTGLVEAQIETNGNLESAQVNARACCDAGGNPAERLAEDKAGAARSLSLPFEGTLCDPADPGCGFEENCLVVQTSTGVGLRPGQPAGRTAWSVSFSVAASPLDCDEEVSWVGGADGSFGEAPSWDPPVVPGAEPEDCQVAVYDGGGEIEVDLGAVAIAAALAARGGERSSRGPVALQVGRVEARNGGPVRFTNGPLEVVDASLDASSLEVDGRDVIVGEGGTLTTSAISVIDEGSIVVDSGGLLLGAALFASNGADSLSFRVENGGVASTGKAEVGFLERGSASVRGTGAWTASGVEIGSVFDESDLVVSAGGTLEVTPPGSLVLGDRGTGQLVVTGVNASTGNTPSLLETPSIFVGSGRGEIEVSSGGLVKAGVVNVRDGIVTVKGANTRLELPGPVPGLQGDLLVGGVETPPGGILVVEDRASVSGVDALQVGIGFGSALEQGLVHVSGENSRIFAESGRLGIDGIALATVDDGGGILFDGDVELGTSEQGFGSITVEGGPTASDLSVLHALGTLTIGSESNTAIRGRLSLVGGPAAFVDAAQIRVRPGGAIDGQGVLSSVENAGRMSGAFEVLAGYSQTPGGQLTGQILSASPAPLLLEGSPAGVLRGIGRARPRPPAPPPRGRLVVGGDASLAGTLEIEFRNGFAPRAGEAFELVEVAGQASGDFTNVVVRGLVPGALPDKTVQNGRVTLTWTEDATALPTVSMTAKPKLKESKKKGTKVKLVRSGDRSSPLVVSYAISGTAENGVDYELLPGTIEIPAGKKSASILVKPLRDGLVERPETVDLELLTGGEYTPSLFSKVTIELQSRETPEPTRPRR